MPVYDINMISM